MEAWSILKGSACLVRNTCLTVQVIAAFSKYVPCKESLPIHKPENVWSHSLA